MSSFVSHALVGYGIGRGEGRALVAACAFCALAPDADYLLLWFGGVEIEPRLSHSIGFVTLVALAMAVVFKVVGSPLWRRAGLLCWLAGLSHLAMDWIVGVHANPLFYPATEQVFASPIGILPSAGRPDPFNPYFWRNLAIEMGIILPLLFWRRAGRGRILCALSIIIAGAVGMSLAR